MTDPSSLADSDVQPGATARRRRPRTLMPLAVAVVAAGLVFSGAGAACAGDGDGKDASQLGNTGVRMDPMPKSLRVPLTKKQQGQWREKMAYVRALGEQRRDARQQRTANLPSPSGGGTPRLYQIPAAKNTAVKRQQRGYWCGPATLQNMIRVMNKVHLGKYSAPSQKELEGLLGTDASGTWINMFPSVLNAEYRQYGSWKLVNPATKEAYLDYIKTDTYRYKQPVIQGVWTRNLHYYQGWSLSHFNYVFGFDTRNAAKKVRIGDPFDPKHLNYARIPVNPYGKHWEPLWRAFDANDLSGPQPGDSDRKRLVV